MLPFLASGVVCLILGVLLLVTVPKGIGTKKAYGQIRQLLAYSAFLGMIENASVVGCVLDRGNYAILDRFVVPVLYYLQLMMMTLSMLKLQHSKMPTRLGLIMMFLPQAIVVPLYIIAYLFYSHGNVLSMENFAGFASSHFSEVMGVIEYVIVIAGLIISVGILLLMAIEMQQRLVTYFSGRDVRNGNKMNRLTYVFLCYFYLSAIDFLVPDSVTGDAFFVITCTVLFSYITVEVLNMRRIYDWLQVMERLGETEREMELEELQKVDLEVEQVVRNWEKDESEPYMREGITLMDAASEMGISVRTLSAFLHRACALSFKDWIEDLRMSAALKLIHRNVAAGEAELCAVAGFTSRRAFERAFRRKYGCRLSKYRAEQC